MDGVVAGALFGLWVRILPGSLWGGLCPWGDRRA